MAFAVLILAALVAGPVALGAYAFAGLSVLGALALYAGLGTGAFVVALVISLLDATPRAPSPALSLDKAT